MSDLLESAVVDPCADCGICLPGGPVEYVRHPVQPVGRDFALADGIAIKQMALPAAGMLVPQHSHRYDHTSMLAVGAVQVWADNQDLGRFDAPCPIFIKAGVKHTVLSLEANTVIYCIHRVDRTGSIEVLEEHHLVKET